MAPRNIFWLGSVAIAVAVGGLIYTYPFLWWLGSIVAAIVGLGVYDVVQTKHAIRRNFPVVGRFR